MVWLAKLHALLLRRMTFVFVSIWMSHLIYHDQLLTNQALTTAVIISATACSVLLQTISIDLSNIQNQWTTPDKSNKGSRTPDCVSVQNLQCTWSLTIEILIKLTHDLASFQHWKIWYVFRDDVMFGFRIQTS